MSAVQAIAWILLFVLGVAVGCVVLHLFFYMASSGWHSGKWRVLAQYDPSNTINGKRKDQA